MIRETPMRWRKSWRLHCSTVSQDSRGNPVRTYDMENPDYTGTAGTASGVCWQVRSGAWRAQELGEQAEGGATFDLFTDAPEIRPFDRCVFAGSVWEVRAVLPRSNHRHVVLEEVGALES